MSCILVVGCYRSGTSAIAGVLYHLGVMMGEKFDEPNHNNQKGFWEDVEFKNIHADMDDGRYENLIRRREAEYKLWGLKDPLLCMHLPRLVNLLRTDHKVIVCRRPVDEIAASMHRALPINIMDQYKQIAEHYISAMNDSLTWYKGPVLEMNHAETLYDPKTHVKRIAEFVGLPTNETALTYIDGIS